MRKISKDKKPHIGFIGQGWVGKNYSDDFEKRGYKVTRYSLEVPYVQNKEKIAECDIVFIAVPTPTTPHGFSDGIIDAVLPLVGKGKIAVIKSTLLPGRTKAFQDKYKDIIVLNSPEFLSRKTAIHDAAHPERNIVGMTIDSTKQRKAAQKVLSVLPRSEFDFVCMSEESEFIKYAHNVNGYVQVVFSNLLFDFSHSLKLNWNTIGKALKADPHMSHRYLNPVDDKGRGAGGDCFIKDFEAFLKMYSNLTKDKKGIKILEGIRDKNVELLISTNKDMDLLRAVYGGENIKKLSA